MALLRLSLNLKEKEKEIGNQLTKPKEGNSF